MALKQSKQVIFQKKKIPFCFKPRKEKIPWKSRTHLICIFPLFAIHLVNPWESRSKNITKFLPEHKNVSCNYEWFSSTRFWNAFCPSHFHHHTAHNNMHAPYHQYFPLANTYTYTCLCLHTYTCMHRYEKRLTKL